MSKEDVLAIFESVGNDPAYDYWGNLFSEHVKKHAKALVNKDREGLIEALREWIWMRSGPETMLAVEIAGELKLHELKPEIETLRNDIAAGKVLSIMKWQLRVVDSVLSILG